MKSIVRLFAAVTLTFVMIGCYKPGCTDPAATNYNADAKQDDLSCKYSASIVFWATQTESEELISLGHDMLRFELDGVVLDSISTASFSSASGGCNTSGTKTLTREFAGNTERSYKYRVRGDDGVQLYEGFVTAKADDCVAVKLD